MNSLRRAVTDFLGNKGGAAKTRGMILFGLPGAGKGTYGSSLSRDFQLLKVAPGDLIRKMLKDENLKNDALTKQLRAQVDKGLLVSDEVVMNIVSKEIESQAGKFKGVILDGIPRTVSQVALLKQHFDLSQFLLINVILREDILIEKLGGRRVCGKCGRNYNVCTIKKDGYEMEPLLSKKGDKCEDCDGQLQLRNDDKEHVIKDRIAVYKKETFPVMDMLAKATSNRIDFEPKRGVKDYPQLKKEVEKVWG